MFSCLKIVSNGLCRIAVRVKVNARRSQVLGISRERGTLEVALNAPPRDGEANAELIEVMSEFLNLPERNIIIFSGSQNREKVIEVTGNTEQITAILGNLAQENQPIASGVTPPRYTKSNLPSKICEHCGRPFNWRKKWERSWDQVRYCSDRCRAR